MELLVHASRCFRFLWQMVIAQLRLHIFCATRYCCWSEINVMNIALSITSFQKTGAISFEISF